MVLIIGGHKRVGRALVDSGAFSSVTYTGSSPIYDDDPRWLGNYRLSAFSSLYLTVNDNIPDVIIVSAGSMPAGDVEANKQDLSYYADMFIGGTIKLCSDYAALLKLFGKKGKVIFLLDSHALEYYPSHGYYSALRSAQLSVLQALQTPLLLPYVDVFGIMLGYVMKPDEMSDDRWVDVIKSDPYGYGLVDIDKHLIPVLNSIMVGTIIDNKVILKGDF